ncbi:uncharacterized [Tachysurus ichikawai]
MLKPGLNEGLRDRVETQLLIFPLFHTQSLCLTPSRWPAGARLDYYVNAEVLLASTPSSSCLCCREELRCSDTGVICSLIERAQRSTTKKQDVL